MRAGYDYLMVEEVYAAFLGEFIEPEECLYGVGGYCVFGF